MQSDILKSDVTIVRMWTTASARMH